MKAGKYSASFAKRRGLPLVPVPTPLPAVLRGRSYCRGTRVTRRGGVGKSGRRGVAGASRCYRAARHIFSRRWHPTQRPRPPPAGLAAAAAPPASPRLIAAPIARPLAAAHGGAGPGLSAEPRTCEAVRLPPAAVPRLLIPLPINQPTSSRPRSQSRAAAAPTDPTPCMS
jgi:hypothetical protein